MEVGGTTAGETLTGTDLGDIIWGLGGNDVLYGYGGNDILIGGSGNDILVGGGYKKNSGEVDYLFGDSISNAAYNVRGNDKFVFGEGTTFLYQGSGYAVVFDWNQGDKIQLGGKPQPITLTSFDDLNETGYSFVLGGSGDQYYPGIGNINVNDTYIFYNKDLVAVVLDANATSGVIFA